MRNGRFYFDINWFNEQIAAARPFLQYIDFIQLYNEKHNNMWEGLDLQAEVDFNWECAREGNRQGFHTTVGNLAMGNLADHRMAPKEPDQFKVWQPMLKSVCEAGNVLCIHPYNSQATPHDPEPDFEWNAGRWVHWCELEPSLRVIGCEALVPDSKDPATGRDAELKSPDQVVWQMRTFDRLIRQAILEGRIRADQFLGYDPFTGLPTEQWMRFNMENVYPAQRAYLLE
jgi:hypothetical protein